MMNWTVYNNRELTRNLPCGCEVILLNPFNDSLLINFCKGEETPLDHKQNVHDIVLAVIRKEVQIQTLMNQNNA